MEPTSFPVQAPWHPFNFRSRKLHLVSRLNSSDFNFYLLDLFIPLSAALYHPTIHLSDIFFCVWVYESRLSFFLCKPAYLKWHLERLALQAVGYPDCPPVDSSPFLILHAAWTPYLSTSFQKWSHACYMETWQRASFCLMPLFLCSTALGSHVEEVIHNHSHSLPETDSLVIQVLLIFPKLQFASVLEIFKHALDGDY